VGNLPSEKDRLAKCAIISENTVVHRITKEVGIMSIVEVLAGDDLRTRLTSSAVTGGSVSSAGPQCYRPLINPTHP